SWDDLVTKRKNIRGLSSYYRRALGNGRWTRIPFFILECLSSRPDKPSKPAEHLIKPWPLAFKTPAPARPNKPSRTCRRSNLVYPWRCVVVLFPRTSPTHQGGYKPMLSEAPRHSEVATGRADGL